MSVRLRLAAVLLGLLPPVGLLASWAFATLPDSIGELPALPDTVGSWTATHDQALEADVLEMIDPDAYVMRHYEAPDRTSIWVYAGFYRGRAGYGKGAHDAEICYPAQGWEIVKSEAAWVPLDNQERLLARRLSVHLDTRHESVLYWFQPAARWPNSSALEQVMHLFDAALGRPQYAFVRISGSADNTRSHQDLAEFARGIAPPLRRAVEELN